MIGCIARETLDRPSVSLYVPDTCRLTTGCVPTGPAHSPPSGARAACAEVREARTLIATVLRHQDAHAWPASPCSWRSPCCGRWSVCRPPERQPRPLTPRSAPARGPRRRLRRLHVQARRGLQPAQHTPSSGLTVGNGHTGAMVWKPERADRAGLGADLSEQSTYAAGLVNLAKSPRWTAGTARSSSACRCTTGRLTTKYDSNRTVTMMGSPNSEVMASMCPTPGRGVQRLLRHEPVGSRHGDELRGRTGPDRRGRQSRPRRFDRRGLQPRSGRPGLLRLHAGRHRRGGELHDAGGQRDQGAGDGTPTSDYTIWFTAASRKNAPTTTR